LRVTRDDPGRLLLLEGEGARIPGAALGCGAIVVLFFLSRPAYEAVSIIFRIRDAETPERIFAGVVTAAVVAGALALVQAARRKSWQAYQLRADRDAGELEFVERNIVTGRDRKETIPLMNLAGLGLETITRLDVQPKAPPPLPILQSTIPPNVRIAIRVDDGSRKEKRRVLELHVDGVDRREEIADLAYRMGAAAGLSYARVVRSDPRDIELALSASMDPGHEKLPVPENRANYGADVYSKAALAAAAEDRVPPFDPAQFPSEHKVEKWIPGREVALRKPMGLGAIGCLPFLAAGVLAGPWVAYRTLMRTTATMSDKIGAPIVVTLFGLFVAILALVVVWSALPRRASVDWDARTITLGGLFKREQIGLAEVQALEARCVRTYHSGSKNSSSYYTYRCDVMVHRRGAAEDAKPLLLVSTTEFRHDSDTPYRRALPLVTELAEALGVPRRVTDYEGGLRS
jgi:hypothetical protein